MTTLADAYRRLNGSKCTCGQIHRSTLKEYRVEAGALLRLPGFMKKYDVHHPYLLADENTWAVAGQQVWDILTRAGYVCSNYVLPSGVKPEERTVGSVVMHYDSSCDVLIAIGSGVINDTGKLISWITGTPYFIAATAPSMDGYNAATSSMERDGVKISLNTRCPDVILGDLKVLCQAPADMLKAGLGDMMAKYISICEWRIGALLLGESYCEEIAGLVRRCLADCMEQAEGLMRREPSAVASVLESLIICGGAAQFAGSSRPASGVEHYFSHIWDMRSLCFGTPAALHGIQCGIGLVQALRAYRQLRGIRPDRKRALASVEAFDYEAWKKTLRSFVGTGAESMIALEAKEKKYDKAAHAQRLEKILLHWSEICAVIDEELPHPESVERIMDRLGMPREPEDVSIDRDLLPLTFMTCKDIRDKYVLPRLCWDLGVLDEIAQGLL